MSEGFVLLLHETQYHPESYLLKLRERFEITSIITVTGKDELRRYNKRPLFNERYLVIFEDVKIFEENEAFLSFDTMVPVVHVETRGQLSDAKFLCRSHNIPYKVYFNDFTRDQAMKFIRKHASCPVSESVCKAIIRQTGLSPFRLIIAIGVCEQVGYSESKVTKYIDKWVYPSIRKLLQCLLGVPPSKAAINASIAYIYNNRHWYKYIKRNILDELDSVLEVYRDKLDGKLEEQEILGYIESHRVTRSRVMFALKLFDSVSIASVFALREFLQTASLMELALRLAQEV